MARSEEQTTHVEMLRELQHLIATESEEREKLFLEVIKAYGVWHTSRGNHTTAHLALLNIFFENFLPVKQHLAI